MKVLKRTLNEDTVAYLKWTVFGNGHPLDLNGCILFTDSEARLNPPGEDEEYQHYGCYQPIGELK